MNTTAAQLNYMPAAMLASSPENAIREIVERFSGISPLPPTKRLTLHHIRGVSNAKYFGGEDKDVVIYGPEFLYVLDVGLPAACGVQIGWSNSGRGDPMFPSFKDFTVRSILGLSRDHILFPCIPTELLVGVKAGTPEATVRTDLAAYSTSISVLANDLYIVTVKAFHEREIGQQIESNVDFVKYVELNRVVRLIDFSPGWFVDQVC